MQFVGAKTFNLENGVWVDTGTEAVKAESIIKVIFDSKEYWDLLSKSPELREVLALGPKVKFVQGGKVFEIVSSEK